MPNYNKVILVGNLTRDPELKHLENDNKVCNFGLAVNRQWKNQAGEKQEDVCFVDIVAWGRTAETCNEYLRKGRPVLIEGRLQLETWTDRDTNKERSKLKVVAENVQFLGSRDGGEGGSGNRESSGGNRSSSGGNQNQGNNQQGVDRPAPDNYDDIPF